MYDGSGFHRDGIKKIIPQLSLRYYFGDPYGKGGRYAPLVGQADREPLACED